MSSACVAVPPDPESLHRQIKLRLDTCNHSALRSVKVGIAQNAVILQGTVPTFFLKQVAQTLARIDGVERVVNGIEVRQASI